VLHIQSTSLFSKLPFKGRTNGRRLGTFQKSDFIPKIWQHQGKLVPEFIVQASDCHFKRLNRL
jgi:hypothetical protein